MRFARSYAARVRQFAPNARLYLIYTFLSGLGFGIYRLFYNLYVLSLGNSASFLGLLVAVPGLVITVLALPIGALGARTGFRVTLIAGVAIMIGSLVGIAVEASAVALILFAAALGLSRGLLDVSNAPFVAENSAEQERTHLFSVQFAVRIFAGFFGFSLAGALPAMFSRLLHVGAESPEAYRAALLCGAGVFFVALGPLARLNKDSREHSPNRGDDDADKPAASPTIPASPRLPVRLLGRLFAPEIAIGLGAGALVPFLNVFFKSKFGVSDTLLGILYAGQSVAMGVAILLGPVLAARLGRPRAVVMTQLLSIPFLILLGFTPFIAPAAVGFLMRASLMNMGHPLYSAFSMDQVGPRHRALASGLLVMTSQGSRALSSWASGILQEGPGFAPVFAITCACYFTASVLIFVFFIRRAPQAAPVDAGR